MVKIMLLSLIPLLITLLITPLLIKFSLKINATDKPNHRKVHTNPIPTLGGLAIFIGFFAGLMILQPESDYHVALICGGIIILGIGFVDDLYNLSAKTKFIGQITAAVLVVFWGGLQVEFINLPFGGQVEFGLLSSVVTILWIVGVTNAINLIDGLDGLAAGISSIALITISGMAIFMGDVYVATIGVLLLFSTLGFLRYNFYPARIFMGDTGALFLGYMISVLALLGFKNITMISFVIPIFILGVPISDTLIAMIRRYINNQPISSPDSSHIHHRLVKFGFSHKQTVLFLYGLSALFSVSAILFSMTTIWGSILILVIVILAILYLIENLQLISSTYKPFTNLFKGIRQRL